MEPYAKMLPISDLIAEADAYMVSLGYTPYTLRHYRQAWNALKNLAHARGEIYFTKELGFELLREHYHVEPYDANLSEYKSVVRRSVMLLLEYQISGTIAKRIPKCDGKFTAEYEEVGEKYISFLCESQQLKGGTISNHRLYLRKAFDFFVAHGIKSISYVDIDCINVYLKTFAGYSKSYINTVVHSLEHFFEFAFKEGYITTEFCFPKVSVYKDRKVPGYYSAEEICKILDAVDRANPLGKRNYAMIILGARYGLRISDIKALKLSDVDFVNNSINIIQQKTGKPLTLDLLPDVGWAIIDYLQYGRPKVDYPAIFLRHTHPYAPFASGEAMQYMIRQYALAAGVRKNGSERCSFHMLRYSLASDLLLQNVSLTTISGILGHSELNVTTTYTQLDVPQLKACALEVPV